MEKLPLQMDKKRGETKCLADLSDSIADRPAIGGDTTVIIGNRAAMETFSYGDFKAWMLDTNSGGSNVSEAGIMRP